MAPSVDPEAVGNLVAITSLATHQAELLLKANDGNVERAVNAYYDNPSAALQSAEKAQGWDASIGPHSQYAPQYPGYPNQDVPTFNIDATDTNTTSNITGTAPSRPPSRISHHTEITDLTPLHAAGESSGHTLKRIKLRLSDKADPNKSMSAEQRLEYETQQAIQQSLEPSDQENGITSAAGQQFGPANRDYYNEQQWAMTIPKTITEEVILQPEPEDRVRATNDPAFLRPSEEAGYLAPLITILHSIPLAREALLCRSTTLPDYGEDGEWWNGNQIIVSKVVSLPNWNDSESDGEPQWQSMEQDDTIPTDVVSEVQRLMAFLDGTKRAYGSADALARIDSVRGIGDPSSTISNFLDAFVTSTARNRGEIFATLAAKRNPVDGYLQEETCLLLDISVDRQHGQSLYDVVDRIIWSDRVDEDMDEVWFKQPAPLFTMRLKLHGGSGKSLDVKIPPVWYPGRYSEEFLDLARDVREGKLNIAKDIDQIDKSLERHSSFKMKGGKVVSVKELLDTTAKTIASNFTDRPESGNSQADGIGIPPRVSNAEAKDAVEQLRIIAANIEKKVDSLKQRKELFLESWRELTKGLTDECEREARPDQRYTLRGFSTKPNITYILRRDEIPGENPDTIGDGWQWWRISFSKEEAKKPELPKAQASTSWGMPVGPASEWQNAKMKEKAYDGPHFGYSLTKLREVEALKAAREESDSILLVYASDVAVRYQDTAAPYVLEEFVRADNDLFTAELVGAAPLSPYKRKRTETTDEYNNHTIDMSEHLEPAFEESAYQSFEGQESTSLLDTDVTEMPLQSVEMSEANVSTQPDQEMQEMQEMQEKSGPGLLSRSSTNPFRRGNQSQASMDRIGEEVDEDAMEISHVEFTK